jgi:hypothetical protein
MMDDWQWDWFNPGRWVIVFAVGLEKTTESQIQLSGWLDSGVRAAQCGDRLPHGT